MNVLLVGPEQEEKLSIRYLSAALEDASHQVSMATFNDRGDISSVLAKARDKEKPCNGLIPGLL